MLGLYKKKIYKKKIAYNLNYSNPINYPKKVYEIIRTHIQNSISISVNYNNNNNKFTKENIIVEKKIKL